MKGRKPHRKTFLHPQKTYTFLQFKCAQTFWIVLSVILFFFYFDFFFCYGHRWWWWWLNKIAMSVSHLARRLEHFYSSAFHSYTTELFFLYCVVHHFFCYSHSLFFCKLLLHSMIVSFKLQSKKWAKFFYFLLHCRNMFNGFPAKLSKK